MSRAEIASVRAAEWIIAQEDGDWSEERQQAFELWLAENDGNKAAYWRLRHAWREVGRMAALRRRSSAAEDNASEVHDRRWWLPTAIAASAAALIGIGYANWQAAEPARPPVATAYATPIGKRKIVGLPDGSSIQLNTASTIRTLVTNGRREVWLDRGEAFFEIAHRDGLPFVVHAGDRQVTVLGTKFSVRRDGDKMTVSVLQGRVRVDEVEAGSTIRSAIVTGGDVALAQGHATLVTTRSEERVESALAWRTGMLSFDQTSLAEVAAEFNRYNAKQMSVSDAGAASIRIGGMFPSSDPEAFVRLIRDAYGLKVEETSTTIKISS